MKYTVNHVYPILKNLYQSEPSGIEPVGVGEWSQAFYFQINSLHKVVRFSRFFDDFQRDSFAARFNSPGLPVPPVEHFGPAFDGYFAVTLRVFGTMLDRLTAPDFNSALPSLLQLFNSLRLADPAGTQGFGSWSPEGNGTRPSWHDYLLNLGADLPDSRLIGWRDKLVSEPGASEFHHKAHRYMAQLVPACPNVRHLVHNDLLHFNVLVDKGRITGVIDWGCALWGDYLYDLTMFAAWQFYYPSMKGVDIVGQAREYLASQGADLTNFDNRLLCYQIHLFLDAMAYCAYSDNWVDFRLARSRLEKLIT